MNPDIKDIGQPGSENPSDTTPAEKSVELLDVKTIRETASRLHIDIVDRANTIHAEIEDLCQKTEQEQMETGCLAQLQALYENLDRLVERKEIISRQLRLTEGYADWFAYLLRGLTADNLNEKNEAPLSDDSLIRLSGEIARLAYEIPARQKEIESLDWKCADLETKYRDVLRLASIDEAIAEREAKIAKLDQRIRERDEELKKVYAPSPKPAPTPAPAPRATPAPAPTRAPAPAPAPAPAASPSPEPKRRFFPHFFSHGDDPAKSPSPAPSPAPSPGVPVRPGSQLLLRSDRTGLEIRGIISGQKIGSSILNRLGEDYRSSYEEEQFEVHFKDGAWYLSPCPGTTNKTFVNGAFVPDSVSAILHDGDSIAVGNPTTNKTVLPVQVGIVSS